MGGRKSEYCAIKGCKVNKKNFETARFFLFPKKQNALKRWNDWVKASRHSEECITKRKKNFVCCAHFDRRKSFINTLLKKNAVPELLLDEPIADSSLQNLTNCTCDTLNKPGTNITVGPKVRKPSSAADKKLFANNSTKTNLTRENPSNELTADTSLQSITCDNQIKQDTNSCEVNENLETAASFTIQFDEQLVTVDNNESYIIIHNPHLQ